MTYSWTMIAFNIGGILLILIPLAIWFYREIYIGKSGDVN